MDGTATPIAPRSAVCACARTALAWSAGRATALERTMELAPTSASRSPPPPAGRATTRNSSWWASASRRPPTLWYSRRSSAAGHPYLEARRERHGEWAGSLQGDRDLLHGKLQRAGWLAALARPTILSAASKLARAASRSHASPPAPLAACPPLRAAHPSGPTQPAGQRMGRAAQSGGCTAACQASRQRPRQRPSSMLCAGCQAGGAATRARTTGSARRSALLMGPGRGPCCCCGSTLAFLRLGSYVNPLYWHHSENHLQEQPQGWMQ
jgi:hypothetical protein